MWFYIWRSFWKLGLLFSRDKFVFSLAARPLRPKINATKLYHSRAYHEISIERCLFCHIVQLRACWKRMHGHFEVNLTRKPPNVICHLMLIPKLLFWLRRCSGLWKSFQASLTSPFPYSFPFPFFLSALEAHLRDASFRGPLMPLLVPVQNLHIMMNSKATSFKVHHTLMEWMRNSNFLSIAIACIETFMTLVSRRKIKGLSVMFQFSVNICRYSFRPKRLESCIEFQNKFAAAKCTFKRESSWLVINEVEHVSA